MIIRWWSVAPIGWAIVHDSITVLQSWNIKKKNTKNHSVLVFFRFWIGPPSHMCVCAVYLLLPPEVFTSSWSWVYFIGLLTSSWTLGEWDVTFPPPVMHNDAVASDSPSTHVNGLWFLICASVFPSREQNGLVNVSERAAPVPRLLMLIWALGWCIPLSEPHTLTKEVEMYSCCDIRPGETHSKLHLFKNLVWKLSSCGLADLKHPQLSPAARSCMKSDLKHNNALCAQAG